MSNSLTYRMQEGLARVQENGRFAMDFLVNDIRMAGYRGCSQYIPFDHTLDLDNVDVVDLWKYNFNSGIEGINDVNSTSTTYNLSDVVQGTDVVIIRREIGNSVKVVKNKQSAMLFAEFTSYVEDGCGKNVHRYSGFCDGDILLVTDCKKSRIFQTNNLQVASNELNVVHPSSGDPGNNPSSWGGSSTDPEWHFKTDSEIVKYGLIMYYIKKRVSSSPGSLYKTIVNESTQELVEGIQNMQILYGEDTNEDKNVDTYVNAASVSDWDNVRSVKIGLLVSTVDEIRGMDENTETYNVLGTTVGPANDRRIRRVFTATVGLRNRLK